MKTYPLIIERNPVFHVEMLNNETEMELFNKEIEEDFYVLVCGLIFD